LPHGTLAMDANELLKKFFNALPESAQGGSDVSKIYVNRAQDDEHDPVANLLQYIHWDESSGGSYLFSGLRGSGKTTELNRLIKELRSTGVAAYYCDASAYLNLNDPQLSLSELLMTALAGLADAVRTEFGKGFLTDSIWQRTKRLLNSEVELKPTFKLGVDGAEIEIEASLQDQPDFRKRLIEFARASTKEFYDAANDFAEVVARTVRERTGCSKIVLVVDSLERLSAPSGDEKKLFDSLKDVFFNEPSRLRLASFSVIYSAPPYLHAVLPGVANGFSHCIALPNFKVIERPARGSNSCPRNSQGIAKMVAIVEQRFPQWQQALARPVVEHLAWMSGGNVRRYFALLRASARKAALSKAELPITAIDAPSVQHAISEAAIPLQWLTGPDRTWLARFMEASDTPSEYIQDLATDLPSVIRLFDHSLVLDYQNGSVWYQVPQLVRECLN
jgi:AAA ATPase domain